MKFKFYEVGGKIRDELLGLHSKDVDYVAVPEFETNLLTPSLEAYQYFTATTNEAFAKLEEFLKNEGFQIFLVTPECYTIRAKFPENHKYNGVADFVLARKELGYVKGTRTPIVKPGTLYDDLQRRDFTVNALARDPDTGKIIDYFGGQKDLANNILRTPLEVAVTFADDPLRILRALRFSITKKLDLCCDVYYTIKCYNYDKYMSVVSEQRIRDELFKMFKHDTLGTLKRLEEFPKLRDYIFTRTNLWLKPTNEL